MMTAISILLFVVVLILSRLPFFLNDSGCSRKTLRRMAIAQCLGLLLLLPLASLPMLVLMVLHVGFFLFSVREELNPKPAGRLYASRLLSFWPTFLLLSLIAAGFVSEMPKPLLFLVGLLMAVFESHTPTRMLIASIPNRDESPSEEDAKETVSDLSAGRVIGALERILVFALVFLGEFTAIGVLVGLKSLARFKELEDKTFSEYFLIGTMCSVTIAGFLGYVLSCIFNQIG